MKYIEEDYVNHHGGKRTRFLVMIGKEETELLYGMLVKAYQYLPRCPETQIVGHRMNTMMKTLREIIYLFKKDNTHA